MAVIAGVWTEACVDATVKDAITLACMSCSSRRLRSGGLAMQPTGIINLGTAHGGAVVDTEPLRPFDRGYGPNMAVEGSVPLRIHFRECR